MANYITIDLNLQVSQKISPLQAEKFVEESLHRFQKLLLDSLATRAEFDSFCESSRECKNIHLSHRLPIYETSTVPDGTFQLNGYSDAPVDDILPPNRKSKNEPRKRNLQNQTFGNSSKRISS